jgi:general secretion pathway protein A
MEFQGPIADNSPVDPDVSAPIGIRSLTKPPADSSASLSYEPFYKLREKPFSLSADPRFLFKSTAHAPAFNALLAGIRRREGLIVLTGEIGSGKTMLCKSVLQALDRRTFSAFVPDPFVSREDLLKILLVDFGVVSIADLKNGRLNGASRLDLSYLLYEFLDSLTPLQAFTVLIIDEAQNLTVPLLEEIRILSELERREKLLQVVLVGQPELAEKLKLPEMRQVDQRVSVRHELGPLDARSVAAYVQHRLHVAGDGGSPAEFTPAALAAVFQGSTGIPRLINRICDRALQLGYERRVLVIEPTLVNKAIDDLRLAPALAEQSPSRTSGRSLSPASAAKINTPANQGAARSRSSRATSSRSWPRAAAALFVAAAVLTGGGWWYVIAQRIDNAQLAALLPAAPRRDPMPPKLAPAPAPDAPVAPVAPAAPAAPAAPEPGGDYLIQVALFADRGRAEQVVVELNNAGFRAREVDRDFGPRRGRLSQVMVGGYDSALAVERDLQRIRELPGYRDAYLLVRKRP